MKISTQRLLLVPLGPHFLMSTHSYASDYDNTKYMMHLPNADLNETISFLDSVQAEWQKSEPDYYEFAILLDDEHIGAVSIYLNKEEAEGELGWIINKKYWGNGYALEAARAIVSFAIKNLKVRKFIAHCDSENNSSYRLMEKLGMSFVDKSQGRMNKASNEMREELMYSMIVD